MTNIIADPQDCPLCGEEHMDFLGLIAYEAEHSAKLGFYCAYCDTNMTLKIMNSGPKVMRLWTKVEPD